MILSRRSGPSVWSDIAMLWGGLLVATFVTDLVRRAPLSPFRDVIISQSYPFLIALCLLVITAAILCRSSLEETWRGIVDASPVAFLIAAIAGIVGPWNDGSGTIALAPGDAALFVITGGILPFGIGPEAITRVAVVVFSIMTGFIASRRGFPTPRVLLIVLASWFAACVPLLVQSWIALASSVARDLPLQHSLDASRALGATIANSYWANFQADRFFSGIGSQVEIASAFSGAALGLVFLAITLLVRHRLTMLPLLRSLMHRKTLLFLSPVVAGFLIGLRGFRLSWGGLDLLSLALAVMTISAWVLWERWRVERKEIADICLLFSFAGGLLLGWPVLALLAALFALGRAADLSMPILRRSLSAGLLVALGGSIAVRSAVLPPALFDTVLLWSILTALLLGFEKKIDSWLRYGFFLVIGLGWIVTLIRFSLSS
jgi:hypothetical protein